MPEARENEDGERRSEQIAITSLESRDIHEAAVVAARAFAPTPLPLAVFRDEEKGERVMSRLYNVMLAHFPGQILVAKEGGRVVGVMGMVERPRCQMTPRESLRLLPIMIGVGPGTAFRAMKGRSIWAKHDPKEPHWHLDPLTIVPERQGRGIGSQLLKEFCARVDKTGKAAYLETDRLENVRLYERFGFKVKEEALAIGVHSWFMWRPSKG